MNRLKRFPAKARSADHSRSLPRVRRDSELKVEILCVWEENFRVYGAHKVWRQLNREWIKVARCTVERLIRKLGLKRIVRDRSYRTTIANDAAE